MVEVDAPGGPMYLYAFGVSALRGHGAEIMIEGGIVLSRIKEHGFAQTIGHKLAGRLWPSEEGWRDHTMRPIHIGCYRLASNPSTLHLFVALALALHPEHKDHRGEPVHHNTIFTGDAAGFETASRGFSEMMYTQYPLLCGWEHHNLLVIPVNHETTRHIHHDLLC